MAGISQAIFSDAISWTKSLCFFKISLKFVPKNPNDNNQAVIKIVAWRRIGRKPLSESMLIHWRIYAALEGAELTLPYGIGILLLCHTDEMLSLKYEIATDLI